jgi:hypothetical protein
MSKEEKVVNVVSVDRKYTLLIEKLQKFRTFTYKDLKNFVKTRKEAEKLLIPLKRLEIIEESHGKKDKRKKYFTFHEEKLTKGLCIALTKNKLLLVQSIKERKKKNQK